MNFELTDDQQAIQRTAAEFLAARYPPERIRELAADERGFTDAQWSAIAELGWPGVMIDEAHDGLELGAIELAVIAEQLGYALAPCPLMPSVWAGLTISAAGSAAQRDRWLPALASGEARGAVAAFTEGVADAHSADVIVLDDGAAGLRLVERAEAEVQPRAALDPTRKLAAVHVSAEAGEPLDAGDPALARAAIFVSLAAESVGVAQRAMEMAVAYAKEREQFGRPIGVNEAISHRCAQMLLEVEGARALTLGAAWAIDHDPQSAERAAAMSKAYASDAGWRVTASALQVHGGIGFTWEHDLHFFLKRARANAAAFGDARHQRDRVVALTTAP